MKRFLFLMLLAAGFAACSDEEETLGGKDIQFAEGTSDKIEVYADETEGTAEGGISFTTTGPWRATVTPVTKAGGADWLSVGTKAEDETSWVAVVPDHGDEAGAYSIRIELGVNATGADRSATITITCGATVITITVTQKGTTESGEVPEEGTDPEVPVTTYPHLVSRIEFAYIPSRLEGSTEEELNRTYEFEYDGEDRISKYSMKEYDYYDGSVEREIAGTLDYSTAGEIRVSERGFEGGDYTLKLNGAGYVESVSGMDNTFEYDEAGRLTKHTWNGGKCWMTLGYNADGVISEGVLHEPGYDDENVGEGAVEMFGTEDNDQLNVDVNMLFLWGLYSNYDWYEGNENYVSTDTVIMGRLDRLGFLRLLGKGADKYVIYGGEYDAVASGGMDMEGHPTPGYEYENSWESTTTVDTENDSKLAYQIESDGKVTSISYTQTWVLLKKTQKYRVTNEWVYRDENGIDYYRVEPISGTYKEEELDRADATYIYRFEY